MRPDDDLTVKELAAFLLYWGSAIGIGLALAHWIYS